MKIKTRKTFYDWCIENNHEDWLLLWDYELNKCTPKDVSYGSGKKYYFKCPRGLHKSELKCIDVIVRNNSFKCKQCSSFGQYLIDEFGENALELYWDYELNTEDPFEISKCKHKKVWIKCQKQDYHGSYEVVCYAFVEGKRCSYCGNFKVHPKDSFGQMLVDEYGSLEVIWDFEKNGNLDPFKLAQQSDKKIWLFCQKQKHHGSYEIACRSFTEGSRCSYCSSKKIHPKDSFAQYHIDNTDKDFLEKYWSKKNTVNPFSISPYSKKKIWIKCQNDEEHENYETTASNFSQGQRCPKCNESKGERRIRKYLNSHNINFIAQKSFSNLIGIGGGNLSYDFYLPEHNLLIEYQGEQHKSPQDFKGEGEEKAKEQFIKQQEHDNRKKKYSELYNIRLLEIWYYDFDNIEELLNKNIN